MGAGALRGCAGALGTSLGCTVCPALARHEWEVVAPASSLHPRVLCGFILASGQPQPAHPIAPCTEPLSLLGTGVRTVTPTSSGGAISGCCSGRLGNHPAVPWPETPLGSAPIGFGPVSPQPNTGSSPGTAAAVRPPHPASVRPRGLWPSFLPGFLHLLPLSCHMRLRFPSGVAPHHPRASTGSQPCPPCAVCLGRARGDSGLVLRPPAATEVPLRCHLHPETQVWELIYSAAA